MTRPVLRLATRINRRTRWTAWGIALACMVLVGSLSLVAGLSSGVDSATARFSSGPTVYLRGTDLLGSAIDENTLTAIPTDYAVVRAHAGTLGVNGLVESVIVASLTQYHEGNASTPFPGGSRDLAIDKGLAAQIEQASGRAVDPTANLTALEVGPLSLNVTAPPSSRPSLFPDTWAWVRPELFIAMSLEEGGPVQAVLTPSPLDPALAAALGLTPLQAVGAVGFTQASVAEAGTVLLGLAGLVAVVIGLLVFNTMGIEILERTEEIRTLRSLGASPRTVLAVYEGQAVLLAVLGAALGSALGIVLVHGIVSFAPLVGFPNLVVFEPPVLPVLAAFALSTGAAFVAGLVPAARALRVLRRTGEARPS